MAGYEERMYQLGVEALAEQERSVAQIRGRGTGLLAAGAVIPSLLAHAVFHGQHPHGVFEIGTSAVGIGGGISLVLWSLLLLAPYDLAFSVDPTKTYQWLWDAGLLSEPGREQPGVDLALADALAERRVENELVAGKLTWFLRLALISLAVEAAGFAVAAALAS